MKRSRFAIAGVAAVIAVAAAALALTRLVGEDDVDPKDNPSISLIDGQSVIARGEDWAFVTWRGTRGLCTSLVFPENEGATSCGIPSVGASREGRRPEHLVVGGTYQGRPDDDLWVDGVVNAYASRVEVELSDGRRVQAPIYDAPPALGPDLKFFLVRTRSPKNGTSRTGTPEPLARAFSAYDAQGRLLDRFGPPIPEKAAIEAAVFRYETTIRQRTWNPHRSAQLRAVDCEFPAPLFRGKPAFRCSIRDGDAGIEARCYALVGRALYEVGGCFDPARDLGAGRSRLLTRSSR